MRLLIIKVESPRYPFMTNPAMIHLISDIPEPAAYFANESTRCADTRENNIYQKSCDEVPVNVGDPTHRKQHIYQVPARPVRAPCMPSRTCTLLLTVYFPAAKLLVQPPPVEAVTHLQVRKPFRNNGNERGVQADTNPCSHDSSVS